MTAAGNKGLGWFKSNKKMKNAKLYIDTITVC